MQFGASGAFAAAAQRGKGPKDDMILGVPCLSDYEQWIYLVIKLYLQVSDILKIFLKFVKIGVNSLVENIIILILIGLSI